MKEIEDLAYKLGKRLINQGEKKLETIKENRRLFLLEGIIFVILGIFAIAAPVVFTFGVTLLLGALFLFAGLLQIIRTGQLWKKQGFYISALLSILYLVVGFFFLFEPLRGALTLTFLLMLFFFIGGIFKIVFALELRPAFNWGWVLVSGIIGILLGAIIWSGWPGTALWVIGLLFGIDLLFFGIALIGLSTAAAKE